MLCEIVGGLLANSLAIMSDAFHLMSDLAGFIVGLVSTRLAIRSPTKRMNFGYKRVEVIGAFSSVVFIWFLTGALLYFATLRMIHLDFEIDTLVMMVMASTGVAINAIMAISISCCSVRIESKANSTPISADKLNSLVRGNINVRAAFIHIIGDLMQSIGVLIASVIIYFHPDWKIADPVCTIVFSCIVLTTTVPIMIDIVRVLTNSFPRQLDYGRLVDVVGSVPGVNSVVELKAWYISTTSFAADVKVRLDLRYFERDHANLNLLNGVVNECRSRLEVESSRFEHINIQVCLDEEALLMKAKSNGSIFTPSFLNNQDTNLK
jgi:cation diffusion facilitator family transporter